VRWFDDWFAIEQVAPGITAIGEPRFHQINWNYLIEGTSRAMLFDTGPGVRDIAKVVRALTELPVTALPSHLHFDHTGSLHRFENIAMADLPVLRDCEHEGVFHASDELFHGFREGMVWNPVRIREWLPIETRVDLGGRQLELLHTPGHSPDSVSLYDADARVLLAADFVYLGPLYAQIPGANLEAYRQTAKLLAGRVAPETRILCAHGAPDDDGNHRAPVLHNGDISELAEALERLRASGQRPKTWPVNARMSLLTWEPAFAAWQEP
jgi:glyoxylase-like metal-dependent hydrolase (beta-lactamase superfamily II)